MKSYSAQLARIHVEHYLSQLLNSLPFLSQLHQDVGFTCEYTLPSLPPSSLSSIPLTLSLTPSVLFPLSHTNALLLSPAWIPQAPPGCLDQHSSNIRDAISVLFMFQRRPLKDKEFSQYCRKWLNILVCNGLIS